MTDASRRDQLDQWLRFVRSNAHVLSEHPQLFFQQAANQPGGSAPASAGWQRWATRLERRPWLRLLGAGSPGGVELLTLAAGAEPLNACTYSPDSRHVVSGSEARSRNSTTLRIWDADTGAELFGLQAGDVKACSYSPDGATIAVAGRFGVTIRSAASGEETARLSRHGGIEEITERFTRMAHRFAGLSEAERSMRRAVEWAAARPRRHEAPPQVSGCQYSPDGRFIVAFFDEGRAGDIVIWDVTTTRVVIRLRSSVSLRRCTFSPDGKSIAGAASDGTIRIWALPPAGSQPADSADTDDAGAAPHMTLAGHDAWTSDCAYSPAGSRILSGSFDATLKIWDARSGRLLSTLEGHAEPVLACAYSPDGRYVLSAGADSVLKIWDADTGGERATLVGHAGRVEACAFRPDGRRIVSASEDGVLKIWEIGAILSERSSLHTGPVRACAIAPDGERVISASEGRRILASAWSQMVVAMSTDEVLARRRGGRSLLANLFPPIRRRPGEVKLWSAERGHQLETLSWTGGAALDCAYSRDGTKTFAAGYREVRVWRRVVPQLADLVRGKVRGGSSWYRSIATLSIWHDTAPSRARSIRRRGRLIFCQWLPDDRYVLLQVDPQRMNRQGAPLSHSTLFHIDAEAGRIVRKQDYPWLLGSPILSPDGRTMVVHSPTGAPVLCAVETGDPIAALDERHPPGGWCGYLPDGRLLCATSEGRIRILDGSDGRELAMVDMACGPPYAVAPHGRHLLAREERRLRVLDLRTGRQIATFDGHRRPIVRFAYSADGARVLSSEEGGTLRVWEVETERLLTAFAAGSDIHCLSWRSKRGLLTFGDEVGRLHMTSLLGVDEEPPIVTAVRIWRAGPPGWMRRKASGRWEERLTVGCSWCGASFDPPAGAVDAISDVERAIAQPVRAPCLDLPFEAWSDARLCVACPSCGGVLRFNPFVVDGDRDDDQVSRISSRKSRRMKTSGR